MKKIIFTLSLLVSVILTSIAQAPNLFNYQATLRDHNGQLLVSDDISIRVSILQFSTDGSPVYTETHATTTTNQGIVNLKIGSGSGADEFDGINWSNGPYFLKVEIDTENSGTYTELGVTQLLSVPYALYAEKANSILNDSLSCWSKNYNNLYYNKGFVGIGTNNPTTKLYIESNVQDGQDRALLRLRNTDIGNKSSVSLALESNDRTYGTAFTQTSASYSAIPDFDRMGVISTNGKGFSIYSLSDYGSIRFYTNQNENGIIERMRINANGNIGIGSINPTTKLYIESNVQDGQDRALLRLRNTDIGNKSSVSLALESNDRTYGTAFTQTSASYSAIPDFDRMGVISTNGKGFSIYSLSDYGSIRFYTNQDENGIIERMRINASGNVGIGTNNPVSLLNIVGVAESGSERNLLQLKNNTNNGLSYTGITLQTGSSNGHSVIQDYGSTYNASPSYDFAGFLNVSNSNRGVMLHANSAEGVIKFYTGHDDMMGAGVERMRIDPEGKIGIGTDNPKAKLEIADGDVYIKDINKGIIMTSPDGQCWRGTINNSGVLEFVAVECP